MAYDIIDMPPEDIITQVELAAALQHLNAARLEEAETLYRKILKARPDNQDALHFLGLIAYQTRRYDEGIELVSKATEVAPGYAEAHNNLGNMLVEQSKMDDAVSRFERAIDLRPNYAGAYNNLGTALKDLGRLDEAIAALQRALAIDPNHVQAHWRLAAAYLSHDDPAAALDVVESCLKIEPYCQTALSYKAIAHQRLGNLEESRRLVDFGLIHPVRINKPDEFDTMESFNEALVNDVRSHPSLKWEPGEGVTRGGSVTKDLLAHPTKAIKVFERMLRRAIDEYRETLVMESGHPFLGRKPPARYRLKFIAAILEKGGWHPAHIHEFAWLSGCYYARVPKAVRDTDEKHAGWIEFGRPDCPMPPAFEPEVKAVRPEPGTAVFFPSYYVHETIPYESSEERVGIAFDAYPVD